MIDIMDHKDFQQCLKFTLKDKSKSKQILIYRALRKYKRIPQKNNLEINVEFAWIQFKIKKTH